MIQEGLVLALDASDRNSYVSGSTTWVDMSGNNNTSTLNNGPTFSSDNGGIIMIDGVNDTIQFQNYNSTYNIRNAITLSATVKRTSGFNQLADLFFLSRPPSWYFYDAFNAGYIQGEVFIDGTRRGAVNATLPFDGFWYTITYTYDSTTQRSIMYKNGIQSSLVQLVGLNNYLIDSSTANFVTIQSSLGRTFNMANFQIYNRALSASEILQNYNATKTRFGL